MNKIYTVSEINNHIKLLFIKDDVLSGVKISGEVSNCKYHSSGHIYFTLKDDSGQISCVMFAGKRSSGLAFELKEGLSIVVTGNINVYERDGKYQMYADYIEQQGLGVLYEKFEALKAKLLKEGLFDAEHKKPIPKYISTLGVITARTGAALQDIINISTRRNPYVKIVLYPAQVQGQGAAQTLIKGIRAMEDAQPDVIIIGRGGGSIEDLFEFNDEELARAIYDCSIPVISAVGHEVDFTICDYVSDLRAPTPSAAAELAVFEYEKFEAQLVDYHYDLLQCMNNRLNNLRMLTERYRLSLNNLSPSNTLKNYKVQLKSLDTNLTQAMNNSLTAARNRLRLCAEGLNNLSPLNSLIRGYSYTTDQNGHNITSTDMVKPDDRIFIDVTDGRINAIVDSISKKEDT